MDMQLGKNEHFLMDNTDFGDPADDDILPKLTPIQHHYSTLGEARRAYKVDMQTIKDLNEQLQPKKSTFMQDVKAGVHRTIAEFENSHFLDTVFNGYLFPDSTPEETQQYLEAQANYYRAQREALQFNEQAEGTADSITANLAAGASQVLLNGLVAGTVGLATGGVGGLAYITASTAAQEASDKLQEWQEDYQNKHNGSLEGFDYTKEGLTALAHGGVAGAIEGALGVERMFTPIAKTLLKKGAKKVIVQNALGEGAEEFFQEASGYAAGLFVGHDERTTGQFLKDALINATYGAVLGGGFGAGMYKVNKIRMESKLQKDLGFTPEEARQATAEMIEQGTQTVMNEVIVRNQLQNAYGDSYNALVDKIVTVFNNAGWQEKYPDRDVREYANTVAADFGMRIIKTAENLGVSVNDVLNLSDISAQGNQLLLEMPNANDPKALQEEINKREAEIKEINKLVRNKKTARKTDLKDQIKILKNRLEVLGFRDKVNNIRNNHSKAMIDQGTLASTAPELIPDLQSIEQADVNDKFVYVGNSRVGVNYVVLPLSEVQGSHINGEPNPNYTFKELQNRTRGTQTDNAILQNRANNFKAEEVLESPNTQYGAPVVNQNREVISGNGRLEVIRKAYELGRMDNYISLLNKLGYNTQGIENPVLVRQVGNLTPEQQLAIAQASNVSETSAFDHARQALNDAKRLTKEINNHLAFADSLPVQERQKYIRENGNYDELALQRRFDDAVLAYILGDTKTFESLVLGNRITQKIASALSQKGSMIVEFDRNFKDLGLKEDLRKALIKSALTKNKANFINSIQQTDIEEGDEFASNSFLYAMTFSNTSSQLSQFIDEYLTRQRGYQDSLVDSFLAESLPKLSKNDIMSQTLRASQITEGKFNEDNTTSDANLKALFLSQIPAENTGYGTTNIEDGTRLYQSAFHGSPNKELEGGKFDLKYAGKTTGNVHGHGVYAVVSKTSAEYWAGENGQVYELDVPEDFELIDEQKRFDEQSEKVRYAILGALEKINGFGLLEKAVLDNMPGGEIYVALGKDVFFDKHGYNGGSTEIMKAASEFLDKLGIRGITYDYGNEKNFVIFNPADIRVIQKFYQQESQYTQNTNGYFDQELKTIVIGSNFNFGTLPHELAHFWLDKVFNIWKRGSTSQAFNEDFSRLAEILNISPEQTSLTRDQQEQFASMTEGYIFNRAAFPNGTKPILDLYTNWIPPQYNSLLDIGFKDSKGMMYNPIFNEKSKQYFDDMYSALAGLRESPMALMFRQEDDDKPADKDVQEARLKALDEGETPTVEPIKTQAVREAEQDIATKSDPIFNEAYESAISASEAAPKTLKKKIESIVRPGRGTNTRAEMDEAAKNFINENPEIAEEIAFDNDIENTSGVDRAVLIINLMEKYNRNSPEYRELYHNLAITRSLAGKTGGLTNDISQSFYLNGYSQIVNRMREKAAVVKYGRKKNAVDLWEKDVDSFVRRNVEKILNTQEGTRDRDAAIEAVMNLAKEEFALEDKSVKLLQTELNRLKRGKRNNQYFRNFATRYLKKYVEEVAGGRPNDVDLSKLMELSVKAQNAQNLLDSSNDAEAVAASLAVREWQDFVASTGIKAGAIDKFVGQYLPRAMLSGISTHVVNNVSNTSSALTTMAATRFYYGKNIIPKDVQKKEFERINKIFKATGMNLAQIGSAKEVSKIHGEEYLLATNPKGIQKWDPMRWLAVEDMLFRSRIYIDTLGKIASKDAKGDVNEAVRLFNEYKKLNSTDETARAKRLEALTTCSLAVFQKDGTLAKLVSNTRNALDLINLEAFGQAGHKGLGTMLAPFAKTPANIVGMGLEALNSPFKLLYRVGQKVAGRDVQLVNSINEAIALANFLPSAAIVLTTLAAAGDYEEPYQPPMPYDPSKPYDSIRIGGVWIGLDSFGAMATPLRIALTMVNAAKDGRGWNKTVGAGLSEVIDELPLFGDLTDTIKYMTTKPDQFATNALYNNVNKAMPALARNIAKFGFRATGTTIETGNNRYLKKFARAYGLDGQELSYNDFIKFINNRAQLD